MKPISVKIDDSTSVLIAANPVGRQEIDDTLKFNFSDFRTKVISIAKEFQKVLEEVKPHEASVEFGIEAAIESGQLTALIVKGETTANVKVTLVWKSKQL